MRPHAEDIEDKIQKRVENMWLDYEIEFLLRAQGWIPGRSVGIGAWVARLVDLGFSILPHGESILTSLGGLTVTPRQGKGCAYFSEQIRFDPLEEGAADMETIEYWESSLGQNLMPLAVTSEDVRIVLGDDDCLYGLSSNQACRHGPDLLTSMRGLLLADRVPELLEPR
jgi:SUKH-3 immunity protein